MSSNTCWVYQAANSTPPGTDRAYISKQFVGASPLKSSQPLPDAAFSREWSVLAFASSQPPAAAEDLSSRMEHMALAEQAARRDLPDALRINSTVSTRPPPFPPTGADVHSCRSVSCAAPLCVTHRTP